MFPFPIARPQGCDIQTFYGDGTNLTGQKSWNKPVGVSHIYMLLIGGGGNGDGATIGGGSGAVTVWYGAAQHVPNSLIVTPTAIDSGNGSRVSARFTSTAVSVLLQANTGSANLGGAVFAANQFTASGFFQSIAGVDGSTGSPTASTTTFLSGGAAVTTDSVTANYGYSLSTATTNINGTFIMQPIIVGLGGKGGGSGGIGCGGGRTGKGGQGMVLIASW